MSFVKLLSRKDGCYYINPKKTNNMKNVVLIGASGFVGTAILNELLNSCLLYTSDAADE